MANRTVKDAKTVKGTNPQYLIEKITRTRIYECRYWKESCFALTAELLVDKAMELKYVGGTYGGNIKPTPFLCLILKMLQIQPEKDIIIELIRNEDYKYVRCLGAYYLRLTGTALDCYNYLEPLYNDYRKLKVKNRNGLFELTHVDEFIETLLHEESFAGQTIPRLQKRHVLEETNLLEPRVSALDDDLLDASSEEDEMPDYIYNEPRAKLNLRRSSPPPRRVSPKPEKRASPKRRSRSPKKRSRSPKRRRSHTPEQRVERKERRDYDRPREEKREERPREEREERRGRDRSPRKERGEREERRGDREERREKRERSPKERKERRH